MHKDDFTWHHIISVIKSIEVGRAVEIHSAMILFSGFTIKCYL